jgi:hypothetical protein
MLATSGVSFGARNSAIFTPYSHLPCSHLLISRPSKSAALENYVVELSEQSTHIAAQVCTCVSLEPSSLYPPDAVVHAGPSF